MLNAPDFALYHWSSRDHTIGNPSSWDPVVHVKRVSHFEEMQGRKCWKTASLLCSVVSHLSCRRQVQEKKGSRKDPTFFCNKKGWSRILSLATETSPKPSPSLSPSSSRFDTLCYVCLIQVTRSAAKRSMASMAALMAKVLGIVDKASANSAMAHCS